MMVVTSMYTANLAASLTVNNMDIGIKSVKDLLAQVNSRALKHNSHGREMANKLSIRQHFKHSLTKQLPQLKCFRTT